MNRLTLALLSSFVALARRWLLTHWLKGLAGAGRRPSISATTLATDRRFAMIAAGA